MPYSRAPAPAILGLGAALLLLPAIPDRIAFRDRAADGPARGPVDADLQEADRVSHFLPIGIYLGSPEEGARVLTAVRLYPETHPDALGHEYPTAFGFRRSEVELLVRMGRLVGLDLYATLMRHPSPPEEEWGFDGFSPPPPALLQAESIEAGPTPVPGVRVVAYVDGEPLAYLVDTRGLSLEERGMERATSSGLDIPRTAFVSALEAAGRQLPAGPWLAVFGR